MGAKDSTDLTDSTEIRQAGRFGRVIWRLWFLLVWVIPLALFIARFLLPGAGWETIMLMLYLPIWYPLLALAGMVPWWVWRWRVDRAGLGKTWPPSALLFTGMVAHWGGLILATLAFPGFSDDGRIAPMLSKVVPALDARVVDFIGVGGLVVACVGIACAILVSCFGRTSPPTN